MLNFGFFEFITFFMKTKTTLKTFQKKNKVKALSSKQQRKVLGGLLEPMAFFKCQGEHEKDTDVEKDMLTPLSFFR